MPLCECVGSSDIIRKSVPAVSAGGYLTMGCDVMVAYPSALVQVEMDTDVVAPLPSHLPKVYPGMDRTCPWLAAASAFSSSPGRIRTGSHPLGSQRPIDASTAVLPARSPVTVQLPHRKTHDRSTSPQFLLSLSDAYNSLLSDELDLWGHGNDPLLRAPKSMTKLITLPDVLSTSDTILRLCNSFRWFRTSEDPMSSMKSRTLFGSLRSETNRSVIMKRSFSSPASPSSDAYSLGLQILHWMMGGSMVACVGLVLAAQNEKDKKLKGSYMFFHKSFGLLSMGLLGPRLLSRFASKLPGPVAGSSSVEQLAATASHWVLYGFAIVLPVSGTAMALFSGYGIPFFYTTLKSPMQKQPATIAGQAFEYFLPLHVGGALYHVIRGHAILPRIIPGLAKAPKP
eukprot:gene34002-43931_t